MYSIEYLDSVVKKDIPKITKTDKEKVQKAIEIFLKEDPIKFGNPLKYSLKGCRKLKVGNYRIIYKVTRRNVLIVKVGHRKDVYLRK